MTKKNLYITLGVSIGIAAGGAILYFSLRKKKGDTEIKNQDEHIYNPDIIPTPKPYPISNATFPLKLGSVGANVMNVNIALGLTPSAYFTNETLRALQSKFNVSQVTESDYNKIGQLILKWK